MKKFACFIIFASLISLCSFYRRETDLQVIISIQDEVKDNPAFKAFSKEKNLNIYRIIQEIMNNAVNHADAESLSLLIRTFDDNNFRIIISDDGKGTQVTVTVPN